MVLSRTTLYKFRKEFHKEIIQLRKVALRLGRLDDQNNTWQLKPRVLEDLRKGARKFESLSDNDYYYDVRQKGVDTKIGLDIASLAYKRLVNQIVLIAGDADFVPAAKLARREGIDLVLDPMWQRIPSDLTEHIDGLRSTSRRPSSTTAGVGSPANDSSKSAA